MLSKQTTMVLHAGVDGEAESDRGAIVRARASETATDMAKETGIQSDGARSTDLRNGGAGIVVCTILAVDCKTCE